MKKLIALCLLFCSVINLYAQKIEVKGKIIEAKTKMAIPYVTILFCEQNNPDSVKYSGLSKENGEFSVKIDSVGDYLLRTYIFGFDEYEQKISVTESSNPLEIQTIKLITSAQKIDEVVISTQKQIIKTEAGKISYNVDADPEAQSSSVIDLMRKVPMLSVDGDDNIKLKGSSRYKIFLNGKPSPLFKNNAKEVLRSLPADQVKKIEIITSPGAKYDAEGIGGIINIVTNEKKKISGAAGSVSVRASTRNDYSFSASLKAAVKKFIISTNFWSYAGINQNNFGNIYRENYSDENYRFLNNEFENTYKYGAFGLYGSMSYEFDTLNLLTASFDIYSQGYVADAFEKTQIKNNVGNIVQDYETSKKVRSPWGSGSLSLDYEKISKKNKDRIFTVSYRLDGSPSIGDEKTEQTINPIVNFVESRRIMAGKSSNSEHIGQIDYQIPVQKLFTIETGLKYIMRLHKNNMDAQYFDYSQNVLFTDSAKLMDFSYNHQIGAAYLQLNGKHKKISYKAGLRTEKSFLTADYKIGGDDFNNSNLEFVPSASVSYQINNFHGLSISYDKRIQRPGFYYLNPSINDLDPKSIDYGNPKLLPEHFHNFDLNWNWTLKIGNINSSVVYSYGNDGITEIMMLKENDIIHTTYENYGKLYKVGIVESINLYPSPKFMVFANASLFYQDIQNNTNKEMQNQSFSGNAYSQIRYTITKGFNLSVNYGFYIPETDLQTNSAIFQFYGINLSKKIFKNKVTLSLGARNFLSKYREWQRTTNDANFYQEVSRFSPQRSISFSIKYNFGELKTNVKHTKKTIENTDLKEKKSENNSK